MAVLGSGYRELDVTGVEWNWKLSVELFSAEYVFLGMFWSIFELDIGTYPFYLCIVLFSPLFYLLSLYECMFWV